MYSYGLSCEDPNTAQPAVTTGSEATLAKIRARMVCWVYDANHWKFHQSWRQWMMFNISRKCWWLLTQFFTGFVVFDQIKDWLQDSNGNLSGPKTVVAGLGAGIFESIVAVTPFESI